MKYKLKVNARQFYPTELHRYTETLEVWKKKNIPIELLDEVDVVYITFGHEKELSGGTKTASLCGWKSEGQEAHFHFTLKVSDISNQDYNKVSISELMDNMQKITNNYFKRFLN